MNNIIFLIKQKHLFNALLLHAHRQNTLFRRPQPIQASVFLLLAFFLLTLLIPSTGNAAEITVQIHHNSIEANEPFTLTFQASDDVDDEPDFSPLEKDFQVLGVNTSTYRGNINGRFTKSINWKVTLMALKDGTLTLPSINFGKDKSPEYQLVVKPVQKSGTSANEEFISELDISNTSAYPQSQIIITQRLLIDRSINGYEFSPLKISGIEVIQESLGERKQYQTERNNKPYLVFEQRYVIYPQSEGTLEIAPSIASANITLNSQSQRSPFGFSRSNTKTVRRASDGKTIQVSPIPKTFKGKHWLPAREVQLVEEFPQNTSFTAGEPITRTLSLFVDGQSAAQLPEFITTEIDNIKQYPDKPVVRDNKSSEGITGAQQIKVAIIPSQAGSYTLPAISIPWWNTETNKMEVAKLPKRTFTVGNPVSSSVNSNPATLPAAPVTQHSPDSGQQSIPAADIPPFKASDSTDSGNSTVWKILTLLSTIAWLVTLFLFWKAKRSEQTQKPDMQKPLSLKQAHKQLQNACEKRNAKSCKDALLSWANVLFTDRSFYSLGELETCVENELADKINSLNAHLYKNKPDDWFCDGLPELCQAFEKTMAEHQNHSRKVSQLEALYQ